MPVPVTAPAPSRRLLVVDNRDSYTFNLVQILSARAHEAHPGLEVVVVGADEPAAARAALADPGLAGVVVSPGPGHPGRPGDFAVSGEVIDAVLARGDGADALPLLGVCLGHQGLALRFGWEVGPAPEPRHGWISALRHTGTGPFAGLPQGTRVTRYHSLAATPGPGADPRLVPTAWSEDGVVQAVAVEGAPWWGVQFHPESIASEDGAAMLHAFLAEVERRRPGSAPAGGTRPDHRDERSRPDPRGSISREPAPDGPALRVAVEDLDPDALRALGHDLRSACRAVYARALTRGAGSFWLDSARTDVGTARWSVLGDAEDVLPDGRPRVLRVDRADAADHAAVLWDAVAAAAAPRPVRGGEGLAFRGGLVGFLGYEAGLAGLGVAPPRAAGPAGLPDAWWARPARWVAADHAAGTLHVCVAGQDPDDAARALDAWLAAVRGALAAERPHTGDDAEAPNAAAARGEDAGDEPLEVPGTWRHNRAEYRGLVERCRSALTAGESYELCLTSRFDVDPGVGERVDPLALFLELTERTPTPYAALLEVAAGPGETDADGGFAVVSASPEQFLSGAGGVYSTKPIKGTTPRHADPVADAAAAEHLTTDPKTFAENLMIVDLLRNDLGRVCEPGSVHVPALMQVESYATVHQLVSTVLGRAAAGVTPVDVVRALFPGGSMTGAPKLRSVQLLAGLEGAPRGVYSGALGFLGADGRTELSIVIRTAVRDAAGRWSVGAGGAVVLESDPDAEADEVLLKARSVRQAMARVAEATDDGGPRRAT